MEPSRHYQGLRSRLLERCDGDTKNGHVDCAAAKGCDGVHGPCCSRGLCSCPWSVLPLETMLRSVAGADARGYVHGQWCYQKPCGSPWSMLPLTVKDKKATYSAVSMPIDS